MSGFNFTCYCGWIVDVLLLVSTLGSLWLSPAAIRGSTNPFRHVVKGRSDLRRSVAVVWSRRSRSGHSIGAIFRSGLRGVSWFSSQTYIDTEGVQKDSSVHQGNLACSWCQEGGKRQRIQRPDRACFWKVWCTKVGGSRLF